MALLIVGTSREEIREKICKWQQILEEEELPWDGFCSIQHLHVLILLYIDFLIITPQHILSFVPGIAGSLFINFETSSFTAHKMLLTYSLISYVPYLAI